MRAVGTVSNGAMTLYTINPNVKTIADFTEKDRIAVPTVRLSFNAMMLQMAAEQLWNDPHRLDHLTVALGHPDAVSALSAGYGKATVTAHIGVQPFTDRGLKLPGAHIITDSRKVFGGPLTQITLLVTKPTKEKNPTLFKAVANALEQSIKIANADKRAAAALWKEVHKAPDSIDDLVAQLNDPGFEFTSRPQRIAHFTAFLNRIGTHEGEGRRLEGAVLGVGLSAAGRLARDDARARLRTEDSMKAVLNGHVIAESDDIVDCKGYQYFPPDAVQLQWLERAPKTASDHECPHGVQFYHVVVDGVRHDRAAWCYETPRPEMTQVHGRFGFWQDVKVG